MSMLLSSAVSLKYDGVFLTGPCIDPFNYKVLESSQGAAWTLPYSIGTLSDFLDICKRHKLASFAAAAATSSVPSGVAPAVPVAELEDFDEDKYTGYSLAVGNETKGHSPEILKTSTRIALPMTGLVDSLNAGVAGGIVMHALACGW